MTFPKTLFEGDAFTEVGDDSITVLRVNHDRDPLRALRRCPRQPGAAACRVLGPLLNRSGEHLDDDARKLAEDWVAAR